ncbi:hypothetical protein, partial [Escherichia coli]|uniref:hypothetical protein n=1 Tax=Escherichia coli TaxID=562 RepID=UPI001BB472E8
MGKILPICPFPNFGLMKNPLFLLETLSFLIRNYFSSTSLVGFFLKSVSVPYTNLRAHDTKRNLVWRLLLEKQKQDPGDEYVLHTTLPDTRQNVWLHAHHPYYSKSN